MGQVSWNPVHSYISKGAPSKRGENPEASRWVRGLHGKGSGHRKLAETCLQHVLTRCQHAKTQTGIDSYAILHWTTHLMHLSRSISITELSGKNNRAETENQLIDMLNKFLDSPNTITRWIAEYYRLGRWSTTEISISARHTSDNLRVLGQWTQSGHVTTSAFLGITNFTNNFLEFTKDMENLFDQWSDRLVLTQTSSRRKWLLSHEADFSSPLLILQKWPT